MYCRNIFKFKFYYCNNKDPFNERKLPTLQFHFHNNLSISLINKCDWLYKVQKGEGGRAQKWHWNLSTQEWIQSVEYLNPSAIANHQRPFRPYFELNLHRIKNVGIHKSKQITSSLCIGIQAHSFSIETFRRILFLKTPKFMVKILSRLLQYLIMWGSNKTESCYWIAIYRTGAMIWITSTRFKRNLRLGMWKCWLMGINRLVIKMLNIQKWIIVLSIF